VTAGDERCTVFAHYLGGWYTDDRPRSRRALKRGFSNGVLLGRTMLSYVPIIKTALERHGPMEAFVRSWDPTGSLMVLSPENCFHEALRRKSHMGTTFLHSGHGFGTTLRLKALSAMEHACLRVPGSHYELMEEAAGKGSGLHLSHAHRISHMANRNA
jgi:hypothetical protein